MMAQDSQRRARVHAGLMATAVLGSNWLLIRTSTNLMDFAAVHLRVVLAAIALLALERWLRPSAPTSLAWGNWRTSWPHFLRVAATTATAVLVYIVIAIVVCRLGDVTPEVLPRNIRSPSGISEWLLTGVVVAPLVEEWIYRGIVQQRLREVVGARWAIFVCGLLFWVGHWVGLGEVTPPHHLVAGWLFSWSRERTGSLVAPTLLHALSNLALGLIDLLILTQPQLVHWLFGD